MLKINTAQTAVKIVPLAYQRAFTKNASTLLSDIVRFPGSPRCVPSFQRSIINPIELVVGFADKTKPNSKSCNCFLLLYQVEYEGIFSSGSDYGEFNTEHLTGSAGIAPFWSWHIDYQETRISRANPSLMLIHCNESAHENKKQSTSLDQLMQIELSNNLVMS